MNKVRVGYGNKLVFIISMVRSDRRYLSKGLIGCDVNKYSGKREFMEYLRSLGNKI